MSDSNLTENGASLGAARLEPGMRIKLSAMMLLQYMVWGAWFSVLNKYLGQIGFTGAQIGDCYATISIASIFAPIVFGQIADRWVPTQYLLAGLHLLGAGALYWMTQASEFTPFYTALLIYAFLYVPTISLSNALALHHIPDAGRDFPGIRVFGTIGWIIVGLFVGYLLEEKSTQPIATALVLSIVLGLYCLALPHTPPKGKAGEALPFIRAFGLLKDGTFALFVLVSFIIAVVLAGYFAFTAPFLEKVGTDLDVRSLRESAAAVMTLGQFTEMLLLPFLPVFIRYLGMKWTLMLGLLAWGVRYGCFAVAEPAVLIYLGIALHGVCYDFFFVTAYIHVDNRAGQEIRASAQALFNLVVMGLGMYLGNQFFGRLVDHYTSVQSAATQVAEAATTQAAETVKVVDWTMVWAWPLIGAALALVIFFFGFKEKKAAA